MPADCIYYNHIFTQFEELQIVQYKLFIILSFFQHKGNNIYDIIIIDDRSSFTYR